MESATISAESASKVQETKLDTPPKKRTVVLDGKAMLEYMRQRGQNIPKNPRKKGQPSAKLRNQLPTNQSQPKINKYTEHTLGSKSQMGSSASNPATARALNSYISGLESEGQTVVDYTAQNQKKISSEEDNLGGKRDTKPDARSQENQNALA